MRRKNTDAQIRDERVLEAYHDYQQGRITRREFVRYASMMGASLAALGLGACVAPAAQPVEVTKVVEKVVTPTPVPTPPGGIRRGGRLVSTMAYSTTRFNDPALATDTFVANTYRQVCDWLVRVTPDLVVRPALATKWTP